MPDLDFSVVSAAAQAYAAVPTLGLKLRVRNRTAEMIRSVSLNVQVRIAATQRTYASIEQERLLDLFGEPGRWGQTLKSLLWTITSVQVPGFAGETMVDLPVQCTYDFEVVSAKYFDALQDGEVPLELLFSGSVFYTGEAGLQVDQIGWDKEARFSMPVKVWKDVMRLYFPNSAWLRLDRQTFDRLSHYRAHNTLPSWEAALDRLLEASDRQEPMWTR